MSVMIQSKKRFRVETEKESHLDLIDLLIEREEKLAHSQKKMKIDSLLSSNLLENLEEQIDIESKNQKIGSNTNENFEFNTMKKEFEIESEINNDDFDIRPQKYELDDDDKIISNEANTKQCAADLIESNIIDPILHSDETFQPIDKKVREKSEKSESIATSKNIEKPKTSKQYKKISGKNITTTTVSRKKKTPSSILNHVDNFSSDNEILATEHDIYTDSLTRCFNTLPHIIEKEKISFPIHTSDNFNNFSPSSIVTNNERNQFFDPEMCTNFNLNTSNTNNNCHNINNPNYQTDFLIYPHNQTVSSTQPLHFLYENIYFDDTSTLYPNDQHYYQIPTVEELDLGELATNAHYCNQNVRQFNNNPTQYGSDLISDIQNFDTFDDSDEGYLSDEYALDDSASDTGTVNSYMAYTLDDIVKVDAWEDVVSYCLEKTHEVMQQFLPLKIYYKEYKKKNHIHVANMIKFEIGKKRKCFEYVIDPIVNNIPSSSDKPIKPYTSSLTALVQHLRNVDTKKNIKLNGWVVLKYKTIHGKYKSLQHLLSNAARNGKTVITNSKHATWHETIKKFIIPHVNPNKLPMDNDLLDDLNDLDNSDEFEQEMEGQNQDKIQDSNQDKNQKQSPQNTYSDFDVPSDSSPYLHPHYTVHEIFSQDPI